MKTDIQEISETAAKSAQNFKKHILPRPKRQAKRSPARVSLHRRVGSTAKRANKPKMYLGSLARRKASRSALIQIIGELRSLIIEHHSHNIMKDEHFVCPACSSEKWDKLLDAAFAASVQTGAASRRRQRAGRANA